MTDRIVVVEDAVKTFGGGRRALDGLSLAVPPGVVYGLLGPNGAGKTTLIRVLATVLPLDGGTVRVAGFDARRDPAAVRSRIGLAGQYAAVDDYLTGRENVLMVARLYGLTRRAAHRRTADLLDRIRLADVGDRQVRTYSGGMRRRLDLAASLVGRPLLLLLDEPTTGVDPASRLDLWNAVRDLVADGTTVLLTTQYLEEADRLADRIALIDRGRVVVEGTADELKDRVGKAVVELVVSDGEAGRARAALRTIRGDQRDSRSTGVITVPAPDGDRTLHDVLHALRSAGITATTVGLRKPTLDEAFLALTGSRAGASGAGGEAA